MRALAQAGCGCGCGWRLRRRLLLRLRLGAATAAAAAATVADSEQLRGRRLPRRPRTRMRLQSPQTTSTAPSGSLCPSSAPFRVRVRRHCSPAGSPPLPLVSRRCCRAFARAPLRRVPRPCSAVTRGCCVQTSLSASRASLKRRCGASTCREDARDATGYGCDRMTGRVTRAPSQRQAPLCRTAIANYFVSV